MELWLEPGHVPPTDLFDILTIDDGGSLSGIMLFQWRTELLLRVRDGQPSGVSGGRTGGVLETKRPVSSLSRWIRPGHPSIRTVHC